MADYEISQADVTEASTFMQAFLQTTVNEGDFAEGGALYDLAITAFSALFAFLRKEIRTNRDLQSLRTLYNLPESESVSDAATALLGNWFRSRGQGTFARGQATLHVAAQVDVLLVRQTRFFRTSTHVFYYDGSSDYFIPGSSLRPRPGADGRVLDYTVTVPMVAARPGPEYNLDRGTFAGFDPINNYVTFVENVQPFAFGAPPQSATALISQSSSLIALRALLNQRSNDVTLRELFNTIEQVLTIGAGDPEMRRDLVSSGSKGVRLHALGHSDVFLRLPVLPYTERLLVGEPTPRADGRAVVLRDTAPDGGDFTLSAAPGDVLNVSAGVPGAPSQYLIRSVRAQELEIDPSVPFPHATDEDVSPAAIAYSVGNNFPGFDNKFATVGAVATATTTRTLATTDQVILLGRPIYRITRLAVVDPPPTLAAYVDPVTGELLATRRVNSESTSPVAVGAAIPYRVLVDNPAEVHSANAITRVAVGWTGIGLDGCTVEITYDTLAGFDVIHDYVADRENRVSCANTLVRGQHAVYLSFTVPYTRRAVGTFDAQAAATALLAFINAFNRMDPLDAVTLSNEAAQNTNDAVTVYPFTVNYTLYAPDGRVFLYATEDRVTLTPDGATTTARLTNPTDVGLPATGYHAALEQLLTTLGVADRTVRFLAADGAVAFSRRA
jgi:hypothetical protein